MTGEKRTVERRESSKRRIRKIPISGENRREEFDRRKEERRQKEQGESS